MVFPYFFIPRAVLEDDKARWLPATAWSLTPFFQEYKGSVQLDGSVRLLVTESSRNGRFHQLEPPELIEAERGNLAAFHSFCFFLFGVGFGWVGLGLVWFAVPRLVWVGCVGLVRFEFGF